MTNPDTFVSVQCGVQVISLTSAPCFLSGTFKVFIDCAFSLFFNAWESHRTLNYDTSVRDVKK